MSNFVSAKTSEQISLRSGEAGDWVQVKVGVTWGEMCDLIDESFEIDPRAREDKDAVRRILAGTMQIVRTTSGIAAWGGPGFGDVAVSIATVRKLAPAIGAEIATLVAKYNPGLASDPKVESAEESAGMTSSVPAEAD